MTPSMHAQKPSLLFHFIKGAVRLFYPKLSLVGAENLPDGPAVIVANHCQMHGPIASELYFPGNRYTWCAGQMMHLKEVPAYAFQDFWSQKPRWTHPFYKLLSYLIAPLSVCVFNNAATIAVYRDARVISTFKNTVTQLCQGARVVIFPEQDVPCNNIVYDFQDKFIDIARLYYKKTGKALSFVPMYIAPHLKAMCLGKPVQFSAASPMDAERDRIRSYLMDTITQTARDLPLHKVVPYRNIPKKLYPTNKEVPHEATGG